MKDTLKPGLTHTFRFTVPQTKTVPNLYPESDMFREMPAVLATGFMVGLLEWACIDAARFRSRVSEKAARAAAAS